MTAGTRSRGEVRPPGRPSRLRGITYAAMEADLAQALATLVGDEHVRLDAAALDVYGADATPLHRGVPDAIVFPASSVEVAAVVGLAAERRIPVIPRGSGTNLAAATVPQAGGIVLVLTRMDRLVEVDAENLVAVCEPGSGG